MNPRNWKDIVELVGIGAIVASLVFVGFQLQQEREIAVVDTYGSITESTENLAELIYDSADIWQRGLDGEELSSADRIRFLALTKAVRIHFASIYIRWMRIGPGNPDSVARSYAYALYIYPGLRQARADYTQGLAAGNVPVQAHFSSRRMEESVDGFLKEYDNSATPIPAEKTYVFW